ncbi:MAG: pyridoxamine 5'-phosphate oxidase family protein [Nitrospiraceae bacterium]|nr:pyridoxamine 5'-phosphate oxidase family protein [Nitrospiraceae bacterium]
MTIRYHQAMFTPAVRETQRIAYGAERHVSPRPGSDRLTEDEAVFISARDSFYLATVNEEGWPYVQHRGGPAGFLRVLDADTLAFADYEGNRQLLTMGHLRRNPRVALILMDYPQQSRLKLIGHARIEPAEAHPDIVAQIPAPEAGATATRVVFVDLVAFDWNCTQHITPRYTVEEIERFAAPLRARIAELEARSAEPPQRVST